MATRAKPPPGVTPYWLWDDEFPDPDLLDLTERYQAVASALSRYRGAGLIPPDHWLVELGLCEKFPPLLSGRA